MISKTTLEKLYREYNRREFVHPDPLEFLYGYSSPADRELVALVASSLAYGRVAQILKSVRKVLDRMGVSPRDYVESHSEAGLLKSLKGFKHRFTTDVEMASMLAGARRVIKEHGSLNGFFVSGIASSDRTVLPALEKFTAGIACCGKYLLPCPERGSACKRLNLFLRWMVRKDNVDPGGWKGVSPAQLVVPLDTHMAKIGRGLGLTRRNAADIRMAMEITDSFRVVSPDDPVKYDFALTRFGIRDDMEMKTLFEEMRG
ncbi:MAG: TIGR02757 family protein [Verrucomicrobia bacterium]|nr:TIGR02757 family protein [Verrucomicrobiota bacterium]